MLTLITCTGGRPEAFALCERWMNRQTWRGEIQWIVVDDGPENTEVTMGQTVVRPQPRWRPGEITLARNLLAAIPLVRGEKALFIEDDDWYAPGYIERMSVALDAAPLAGEAPARYYNVATRQYKNCGNTGHASLCQTGLRAELLPSLQRICRRGGKFIDLALWREHREKYLFHAPYSVGIKGLPGRAGIGIGHRPKPGWAHDPGLAVLRSWIGGDAAAYEKFHA